jgi:serine/threonine protein kinase
VSNIELGIDGLSDFVEIGAGGFSTVYYAHEHGFGRRVAVKILHAIDDHGRRRFERELNLMGQLADRPNVVTPYRFGYTDTGAPYLVMEYVAGGSLRQIVDRQQPVDPKLSVGYILPVAGALGRAHQVGILHRDIKPDNILLTVDGVSKLTDFGISGIREATATQRAYTLAHTPPETFADVDLRDERSDLYSLASTLYTVIMGRTPFASLDGSDAFEGFIARIVHNPVPPTGLDPIDRFLAVAMAKDPADRYQTASTVTDRGVESSAIKQSLSFFAYRVVPAIARATAARDSTNDRFACPSPSATNNARPPTSQNCRSGSPLLRRPRHLAQNRTTPANVTRESRTAALQCRRDACLT